MIPVELDEVEFVSDEGLEVDNVEVRRELFNKESCIAADVEILVEGEDDKVGLLLLLFA